MKWTEEVEDRCTVEDVAAALGLEIWTKGGQRGCPCPEHPEKHKNGQPSARFVLSGRAWKCWRANHGGGPVALAAHHITGEFFPKGPAFHKVRAWFAERGWCTPWEAGSGAVAVPVLRPPVVRAPVIDPDPVRLPAAEVAAFWEACSPLGVDSDAATWADVRELDPHQIQALDVARHVSPGVPSPEWAGFVWQATGRKRCTSWAAAGWRLALPVFDANGRMVAVRARWTGTQPFDWSTEPVDADVAATYLDFDTRREEVKPPFAGKEVSPRGTGACKGAVYACPVGQWLLAGGVGPVDASAPDLCWDGNVIVVEGGPAFLRYATERGRVKVRGGRGYTYAVLGVYSGAWPAGRLGRALAARMVRAKMVMVAKDMDDGGEQISEPIAESLTVTGVPFATLEV